MASIRLAGVTMEFTDEGRGEPLLLVHGFPTSRLLWRGVASALADRFRVLAPDLAGYGLSQADGPLDLASQASYLLQLIDALDLPRVAVVAHDVGSAAAQILAMRAPERVRALAIVDGVHGDSWAMSSVASIRAWDPAKAASLAKILARTMRVKDPAMREILAEYEGDAGGRRLIRAAQAFDPAQTASIAGALRKLGFQALVIWAEGDEYLPLEVGRALAERLAAPLVVLSGGHFLPLDAPQPLAHALRSFLAEL